MDKVFEQLAAKKDKEGAKEIPVGTVYEGYKTIPIQKLDLKEPHKKKPMDGAK
jgi:hypothetical protein